MCTNKNKKFGSNGGENTIWCNLLIRWLEEEEYTFATSVHDEEETVFLVYIMFANVVDGVIPAIHYMVWKNSENDE